MCAGGLCYNLHCTVLKLNNVSRETRSRLTVHTVQLLPEIGFRENETYSTVSLAPEGKEEFVIPTKVIFYFAFFFLLLSWFLPFYKIYYNFLQF